MPEPWLQGAEQEVTVCQACSLSLISGSASKLVKVTLWPGWIFGGRMRFVGKPLKAEKPPSE